MRWSQLPSCPAKLTNLSARLFQSTPSSDNWSKRAVADWSKIQADSGSMGTTVQLKQLNIARVFSFLILSPQWARYLLSLRNRTPAVLTCGTSDKYRWFVCAAVVS